MSRIEPKDFGIKLSRDRVKVYTQLGTQVHPSQRAWVYLRGEKQPVRCCSGIHQKGSAARKCGEATAKRLLKEREA